jgi:hypothetical protein
MLSNGGIMRQFIEAKQRIAARSVERAQKNKHAEGPSPNAVLSLAKN